MYHEARVLKVVALDAHKCSSYSSTFHWKRSHIWVWRTQLGGKTKPRQFFTTVRTKQSSQDVNRIDTILDYLLPLPFQNCRLITFDLSFVFYGLGDIAAYRANVKSGPSLASISDMSGCRAASWWIRNVCRQVCWDSLTSSYWEAGRKCEITFVAEAPNWSWELTRSSGE